MICILFIDMTCIRNIHKLLLFSIMGGNGQFGPAWAVGFCVA